VVSFGTVVHWVVLVAAFEATDCINTNLPRNALGKTTSTLIHVHASLRAIGSVGDEAAVGVVLPVQVVAGFARLRVSVSGVSGNAVAIIAAF
jgi:ABC-type sugar transport system substrate-binding protein